MLTNNQHSQSSSATTRGRSYLVITRVSSLEEFSNSTRTSFTSSASRGISSAARFSSATTRTRLCICSSLRLNTRKAKSSGKNLSGEFYTPNSTWACKLTMMSSVRMSVVIDRPIQRQAPTLRIMPHLHTDQRVGLWSSPAIIAPNNFVYKSLSNWAFNIAVGCSHACRFCYVPSAATIKQGATLAEYGVEDPDAEWGNYVLLRPWDEQKFLTSLLAAERTPKKTLKLDGNRAIIYCSTTDPYQ